MPSINTKISGLCTYIAVRYSFLELLFTIQTLDLRAISNNLPKIKISPHYVCMSFSNYNIQNQPPMDQNEDKQNLNAMGRGLRLDIFESVIT